TAQVRRQLLLELALVQCRILERDGERAQVVRRILRRERARDARVESAAQVTADRHVRAHAQADRGTHQLVELLERVGRLMLRRVIVQVVVLSHTQLAVTPRGTTAGLELLYAPERRARRA